MIFFGAEQVVGDLALLRRTLVTHIIEKLLPYSFRQVFEELAKLRINAGRPMVL